VATYDKKINAYRQRYKWVCTRPKGCHRKVRTPGVDNCLIMIDSRSYGHCKYIKKVATKKVRVSKYKPLPLGQVVYTLQCLKERKIRLSELDVQTIDDFISWLQKRFYRVRIMKQVKIDPRDEALADLKKLIH
jgi:hypothetical protein